MGCEGSLKFVFKSGVCCDVFRNDVGVSSVEGFRGNAPGGRGVVTEEFDVEFGGVIMDFGFESGGGKLGRGGSCPSSVEYFQVKFRYVKMGIIAYV